MKAQVFAEEDFCWLCGEFVDQRFDSRHRLSRTVDHLIQLCHGGDPLRRSGLHLCHRACNTARSNALRFIEREDCACSLGLPCARLNPAQPRGYVQLDPNSI